jgi:phosphoribosylformylglycinamidine cyclo-ligase
MSELAMTYSGSGVDYGAMDPFKCAAQAAGLRTAGHLKRLGFEEIPGVRGESAYVMQCLWADFCLAHVQEGLGTKNLVADAVAKLKLAGEVEQLTAESYYAAIGQDTVAMIVNDIITVGALPLSVAMHLAVGDSAWFDDERRALELIRGWQDACDLARCSWGGGETPTLKDIVLAESSELSGSATGLVRPTANLIRGTIRHGDAIVLLASSGIHANGLTLARQIAEKLPNGYATELANGLTYGETLLAPTTIYVPVVEACQTAGIELRYAINITGHGWRKLMRAAAPFNYVIDHVPPVPLIFDFLMEHGPVELKEAYGNFNMGAGFAMIVHPRDVSRVLGIARQYGIDGIAAGYVDTASAADGQTEKRVIIRPLNIEWTGETLGVR